MHHSESTLRIGHAAQPHHISGRNVDQAKDVAGDWLSAAVVQIAAKKTRVLVHFDGWGDEFDEWIGFTAFGACVVTFPATQ